MLVDLHPPASGLPLASVLLLCFAEISRYIPLFRAAKQTLRTTAVISCALTVAGAFISGYQASSRALNLAPEVESALAWHHSLGKGLLVTSLLLVTFYYLTRVAKRGKKAFCFLYYLVLALQIAGTIWVSNLGGRLVFTHGVNVSPTKLLQK